MSFKQAAENDVRNVFLNQEEFAEIRTVKYDGETYADIPVVMVKVMQTKFPLPVTNRTEGVHIASCTAYIALEDLDGVIPEQKRRIRISDGEAIGQPFFMDFLIVTSDVELGLARLELEAYDE